SMVALKPVRQPRPPIYLAGYVPAALRRCAAVSDGWLASSLPLAAVGQMIPQLHAFARQAGRDPAQLEVIYMAASQGTSPPLDDAKRAPLCGAAEQVRADVGRFRDLGVTEVIGWSAGDTLDAMLANLERFREVAG